jgi:hypothetical protein
MATRDKRPGDIPDWLYDPIDLPNDLSQEAREKIVEGLRTARSMRLCRHFGIDPLDPGSGTTVLMRLGPILFPAFRVEEPRRKPGRPKGAGNKWKVLEAIEQLRNKANSNGKPFNVFNACVVLSRNEFKGRSPKSLQATYYAEKKELEDLRREIYRHRQRSNPD